MKKVLCVFEEGYFPGSTWFDFCVPFLFSLFSKWASSESSFPAANWHVEVYFRNGFRVSSHPTSLYTSWHLTAYQKKSWFKSLDFYLIHWQYDSHRLWPWSRMACISIADIVATPCWTWWLTCEVLSCLRPSADDSCICFGAWLVMQFVRVVRELPSWYMCAAMSMWFTAAWQI